MSAQFQVIAMNPRVGRRMSAPHAVYSDGHRSTGIEYTRRAAEALRDWLIERAAGYPALRAALDRHPFHGGEYGCTACNGEGGVTGHSRVTNPKKNCTGPCCRKPPKRVRRA